jgi:HEPN domain-containing protein
MLREAAGPDDPAEWLRRARSSLERARADARLPGVYPGIAEPVGRDEYERAVSFAEAVVRWAAERVESNEP